MLTYHFSTFFYKVPVQMFCPFLNGAVLFEFAKSSLYCIEFKFFVRHMHCISPTKLAVFFILLMVSFKQQKFLRLIKFNVNFFLPG